MQASVAAGLVSLILHSSIDFSGLFISSADAGSLGCSHARWAGPW